MSIYKSQFVYIPSHASKTEYNKIYLKDIFARLNFYKKKGLKMKKDFLWYYKPPNWSTSIERRKTQMIRFDTNALWALFAVLIAICLLINQLH